MLSTVVSRGALLAVACVAATGCSRLGGYNPLADSYVVDPIIYRSQSWNLTDQQKQAIKTGAPLGIIDLDTYQLPGDDKPAMKAIYASNSGGSGGATGRSRLVNSIKELSDHVCNAYKARIRANRAGWDTGTSEVATILSTTASLVTGGAAQVISAGSALTTATRENVSANIYQNTLTDKVLETIDAQRKQLWEDVDSKRGLDISVYPAEAAIMAMTAYHDACSFNSALTKLSESAAKDPAQLQIENIKKVYDSLKAKKASLEAKDGTLMTKQDSQLKDSDIGRDYMDISSRMRIFESMFPSLGL
ncbi:MAG TPA: hypothetical protein VEH84_07805 [Alphaproteobacteria bacterium]|nr:hypothetical protein [Alphaproteobacteria bacterium]